MRLRALVIFTGILVCLPIAQAQDKAPNVVKYHATLETVKYVYGAAPPVARLAPGDVLETNTLDAFGDAIQKPGDTLALVKGDNPLTGPFFIEGAEPGDTIAVVLSDQSTVRFVVTMVESYAKTAFPTTSVYGPVPDAELRVITCGGAFSAGHYLNNVVVYATLESA